MVPWNSASGGFAYSWQSKWVGIIFIKIERKQIQFLSDVLAAVASLDLNFPNITADGVSRNLSREVWSSYYEKNCLYIPGNHFFLLLLIYQGNHFVTYWRFSENVQKKCSKMFKKKMFQNVLVTHRRMIKSILLQNLPLRSNPFAEVIVTSDQAVLIFPFCYSVL